MDSDLILFLLRLAVDAGRLIFAFNLPEEENVSKGKPPAASTLPGVFWSPMDQQR